MNVNTWWRQHHVSVFQTLAWCHLYYMFTHIYSLLTKKHICDRWNVSIKLLSGDMVIFFFLEYAIHNWMYLYSVTEVSQSVRSAPVLCSRYAHILHSYLEPTALECCLHLSPHLLQHHHQGIWKQDSSYWSFLPYLKLDLTEVLMNQKHTKQEKVTALWVQSIVDLKQFIVEEMACFQFLFDEGLLNLLYCIVLKGWSLLPNTLRPFQIYVLPRI